MRKLRVWLKRWLSRHFFVLEFCKECGRTQPLVWHAADQLWDKFAHADGVLCPECFDRRALRRGHLLMWTPVLDGRMPHTVKERADAR